VARLTRPAARPRGPAAACAGLARPGFSYPAPAALRRGEGDACCLYCAPCRPLLR